MIRFGPPSEPPSPLTDHMILEQPLMLQTLLVLMSVTALEDIYIYIECDIYRYIVGDIYRYILGGIYRYIVGYIFRCMVGYL